MDYCGHLMKQCHETTNFTLLSSRTKIVEKNKKIIEFTEEENGINHRRCKKKKFYDAKICRHLCSTTLVLESRKRKPVSPCESICYELTRSFNSAGEICPMQKYCKNGCPCSFYKCEKSTAMDQKYIPAFDLQQSTRLKLDKIKGKFNKKSFF